MKRGGNVKNIVGVYKVVFSDTGDVNVDTSALRHVYSIAYNF